MNSHLDMLQTGISLAKFKAFKEYELIDVNKATSIYTEQLRDIESLTPPIVPEKLYSS